MIFFRLIFNLDSIESGYIVFFDIFDHNAMEELNHVASLLGNGGIKVNWEMFYVLVSKTFMS